ncbi:MAG: cbb3-type cytochrome oxidase assembly protein CcoS [Sneathiellaceae bacterium]
MTNLLFLIPAALLLGGLGLAAFLWCLRSNQFDDLDGAAQRVLLDDPEDATARSPGPGPDLPRRHAP